MDAVIGRLAELEKEHHALRGVVKGNGDAVGGSGILQKWLIIVKPFRQ